MGYAATHLTGVRGTEPLHRNFKRGLCGTELAYGRDQRPVRKRDMAQAVSRRLPHPSSSRVQSSLLPTILY